MRFSAKLQDHNHREPPPPLPPLLLRAKIPITIFNLPFLSHFSTTTANPADLCLSLSTNFASGPSLKLSYATATAASAGLPLSLTLKSGTGFFGSPTTSPLVISAHFSFAHPNPTFSLLFKPQFGSFSLRRSIHSHTDSNLSSERPNEGTGSDSTSFGFVPVEIPAASKDIIVQKNDKPNFVFKGIRMAATTQVPVAKSVALNFRWWANFADDQMPVLRMNKIGIQRVVSEIANDDVKESERNSNELVMLKGMCYWMKRELDVLTRVNGEMKGELEEMKSGGLEFREGVQKKAMNKANYTEGAASSSQFEQWRSKRKSGGSEENGNINYGKRAEEKAVAGSGVAAIDVENELQRAIMAATASS